MLDALLRIAAAESGIAPTEDLDLSPVVQDVVELYRPLAEERRQSIKVEVAPSVPLRGNRQLLAQAIANLMDNAVKYTPEGGSIGVMLAAGTRETGDRAVVEVRDDGPGIPAGERDMALRRSTRLKNALGTAGGGLGLSVVRSVAHLHGGDLVLADNHAGRTPPGLVARLTLSRR
jgi:signal transduction histidine kinase